MKKTISILLLSLFLLTSAQAADIKSLKKLFEDNYDAFYIPRFCGKNTARFISEANQRGINLSHSYVAKFVGAGFLETSGFYTRNNPNDRQMLGYFHMVFVADGYVFDFDLHEPMVLKIEDYIRLQFTPPYESFKIWGMSYISQEQLSSWNVTGFETLNYAKGKEVEVWKKKLPDFVELEKMLKRERKR